MKLNTFDAIHNYGEVVEETERYAFYQLAEVKDRYDSNLMKLKQMPSNEQFEQVVAELMELARKYGNPHGKIVLPENYRPDEELISKGKELGFEWSFLELYEVLPEKFIVENTGGSLDVSVGWITPELVEMYGQMHFEETVQWGEAYATAIREYKKGLIEKGHIRIVVAVVNGESVGSTDVILSEKYVEIDNFFVQPAFQKQGIGTAIQRFVMDEAQLSGRSVILVADGEDTPREMYKKQGYEFVAFQYAALKAELFG